MPCNFRDTSVQFDCIHVKPQIVLEDIGEGTAAQAEYQCIGFFGDLAANRSNVIDITPF
jgi:hypothetical protein